MGKNKAGNNQRVGAVVGLTRIVTKTGDGGTTGLADGTRLSKSHPLVEAIGAVDELNAWVGLLRGAVKRSGKLSSFLGRVQNQLFDLGADLSRPPAGNSIKDSTAIRITHNSIGTLEDEIRASNKALRPLTSFILPFGPREVCICHLARTVCRRAERRVAALKRGRNRGSLPLIYLNRLSDYLFVLSRRLGAGSPESLWKPMENSL